jgi:hypothetical protein
MMEPISTVTTSVPAFPGTLHESVSQTPVQQLLTTLRSSFTTLEELEDVLLHVLAALDSIPLPFKEPSSRARTESLRSEDVLHVLPTIQHVVLTDIIPTWLTLLRDAGHEQLAREFFCPSSPPARAARTVDVTRAHGISLRCKVAASALPTLLAHLHTLDPKDAGPAAVLAFSVSVVDDVVSAYPMDVLHDAFFSKDAGADPRRDGRRAREWEDYVRAACSVPGRVANALQGQEAIVPSEQLDYG